MIEKINLADRLSRIRDPWKPRIIGEINGQEVRLAKFEGTFIWHQHPTEDELFLCVAGRFRLEFRDGALDVGPGELCIVPKGVEHRTSAESEAHVLLFERANARNTGNIDDPVLSAAAISDSAAD